MDTYRIEIPYNKQEFITASYVKWEIHSRKRRKNIRESLIFATVILGLGILAHYDTKPNNTVLMFGCVMEFIAISLLYSTFMNKRKYKNSINEIAEKYDKIKMDCIYEFSEQSIKYWDKEKHLEFNWELFTSYSFYKNYLILHLNNSIVDIYIIEKKESEIEDYNRIYEIVQSKLKLDENVSEKNKKVN